MLKYIFIYMCVLYMVSEWSHGSCVFKEERWKTWRIRSYGSHNELFESRVDRENHSCISIRDCPATWVRYHWFFPCKCVYKMCTFDAWSEPFFLIWFPLSFAFLSDFMCMTSTQSTIMSQPRFVVTHLLVIVI